MASVNTQFSIAVHLLTAFANYKTPFTSEVLARSVNANPVFVKRILGKLSKAKLVTATVGKNGGYNLAKDPENVTLRDIYSAIQPPSAFAIHTYPQLDWCVVSSNIKDVMGEVLVSSQKALEDDLERTTLADVVRRIGTRPG